MSVNKKSNAAILKYFKPVIDALKKLGGSATSRQVEECIAQNLNLPSDVVNESYENGNNNFSNQVAWASNYLVYAGYIDKSEIGKWILTDSGKTVDMTEDLASDICLRENKRLAENKHGEKDRLYEEFNKRFPIEKLPEMTLEQYADGSKKDSFCYWVEVETKDLGSIWGGSAYKFGIFRIVGNVKARVGTSRDEEYAWYSKYGTTRDEVFSNIRDKIVQIANASRSGNYSAIDTVDLGDVFKWKIAFLYSEKKLLDWFKRDALIEFAKLYSDEIKKNSPISYLQTILLKAKGNENLWDFSDKLLSVWEEFKSKNQNDNQENTDDTSVRYWLYAPGKNASKWDEFYKSGIMALGWDEIGDFHLFSSRDEIREKLRETNDNESSFTNSSLAVWQFANEIKKGDIVFVKRGRSEILGRGIVEGDYEFDEERPEYNNVRKMKWTHIGEWEHPKHQAVTKVLTDITDYTDYVEKLKALFDDIEEDAKDENKEFDPYDEDDFLSEVFISKEKYETMGGLLRRKKNIILQGAPGVGKSFAAKRLAYSIIGEKNTSRVKLVQFHQSYSYEDFIVGFRPSEKENVQFEKKYGVFYEFCKKAIDDIENEYFFIIDEINRGNLSKIFGELLLLIEHDKRGKEHKIQLLYSKEDFYVPENVYIIGMMNTADRSLAMIDYALRRRFSFVEFEPAFESEGFKNLKSEIDNEKYNRLIKEVENLNEEIAADASLGKGFRIGHSYFVPKEIRDVDAQWLSDIVQFDIVPLLEEYWFDESEKVNSWKTKLEKAFE